MCHWLQFLGSQNQTRGDQNNGNQCLYCDIEGDNGEEVGCCCRGCAGCAGGEGDVAVECCVLVGGVPSDYGRLDPWPEKKELGILTHEPVGQGRRM
jgi:hypothetical protein